MHSIAEIGTNVPAFLGKLWRMVEDPISNDLIAWSPNGTSFVIKDEIRFARELLPMYYKHNNMASFIRQLNMYGFHKIVSSDSGSMKMETPDEIKFTHPFFIQGHPYLLENIKRKIGVSKVLPGQVGEKTPQVINKVLTDVRQMKGRQDNMDGRLTAMKLENGALWRELSLLRQKHLKQQQMVNKLIQFLVTIVQQNHNTFSVKRKFPRMLQHHKSAKHQDGDDLHEHSTDPNRSPMGPVIHELIDPAEALLETVAEEAEHAESQSDVTDFLNKSNKEIGEMIAGEKLPDQFDIYNMRVIDETIIGLPDNTWLSNVKKDKEYPTSEKDTIQMPASSFILQKSEKGPEVKKPKLVKLISRKPKKTIENQQKVQQQKPVQKHQKNIEDSQKVKLNQQQLKIDRQQIQRNKVQQVQKNQQQKLQKNQQQQRQKQIVVQNPQQQQPPPEPVITTIPFDSGTHGDILSEVNTEDFNLPVVVEVLPIATTPVQSSPLQTSPTMVSSNNLLIDSPMIINDPLMTPQCDSVVISDVVSPASNSDMQVACMNESQVTSPSIVTRSGNLLCEMDNHLDTVQSDLDNLKELLRSEGISLDANTLLGCFNDDPLSYNMPDPGIGDNPKESNGNELITYNPSLFDFTDLMGNEWSLPTSPDVLAPAEDSFAEVNTPQFIPPSPSFPTPAKKRKK